MVVSGARIAVDGRDNVHVIAWRLTQSKYAPPGTLADWKDLQRCIYTRKPAGAGQPFEPAVELLPENGSGSGHGDIARAPNGDIHIVYNVWDLHRKRPDNRWRSTHVVRTQDGDWLPVKHDWRMLAGDFGISIAIDGDGVVHASGFAHDSRWPNVKTNPQWCYFNNAGRADEMHLRWSSDDYQVITTDILVGPSGHVWMTRANDFDRMGRYVRYDASRKAWMEPQSCSPPGRVNLVSRWNQTPKLAFFRGTTRMVFLEKVKVKGENAFRFKQHILGPVSKP